MTFESILTAKYQISFEYLGLFSWQMVALGVNKLGGEPEINQG